MTFETTTDENDCRVWAWIAINIDNTDYKFYGNSIASFWEFIANEDCTAYFHNLKFDGEFILHYLLSNGFIVVRNIRQLCDNSISTLISDSGAFYSMQVKTPSAKVFFKDSLKLLNFSVDKIAKDFHLPVQKLNLDYKAKREEGHILTEQEKDYITNDALIIALALKIMQRQGFKKLTIGSNAFGYYKKSIGGDKSFRKKYPILDCDAFIRRAYRGGYTYCARQYQGKVMGAGIVLDVNSLYPYALYSPHLYPYGKPKYYVGKYELNEQYPLYVQRIICSFQLKPNHLPTIQVKNSIHYIATQYLETSGEYEQELWLTSVDLKLFLDHYDVYNLVYIDGYMFKADSGAFDGYIDEWYKAKAQAKIDNNPSLYVISKLMLNSLYGKFATRPERRQKIPYLKDNCVAYEITDPETCEPVYIPVGVFCTAYARDTTIRAAQRVYDRFMYADTDSLHLLGTDMPDLDIHDTKLGAFKLEGIFDEAKYLHAKMYMEHIRKPNEELGSEQWQVVGAGMTKDVKKQLKFDSFSEGWSCQTGKLRPKHVPGGIVLVDTPFSIR